MIANGDGSELVVINPHGYQWFWSCREKRTYLTDNRILIRIDRTTYRVAPEGAIRDFRADKVDSPDGPVAKADAVANGDFDWRYLPRQMHVVICTDGLEGWLFGRKIDPQYLGFLLTEFPGDWQAVEYGSDRESPILLRRIPPGCDVAVYAVLMPVCG